MIADGRLHVRFLSLFCNRLVFSTTAVIAEGEFSCIIVWVFVVVFIFELFRV